MAKKIKKSASYDALYKFLSDDHAAKLVLLRKDFFGTDAEVLIRVANAQFNDGPITCIHVDDTFDATAAAIGNYVAIDYAKDHPVINYIHILILDLENVNYERVAELSNEDHRIVTTTIGCSAINHDALCDRDDFCMTHRSVILPDGTIMEGSYIDHYATRTQPTKEISDFIDAFLLSGGCEFYKEIRKAATKFANKMITENGEDPGILLNFARGYNYCEAGIIIGRFDDIPLWTLLRERVIHAILYAWAKKNNKLDVYIAMMVDRIELGLPIIDRDLANTIRDTIKRLASIDKDDEDDQEWYRQNQELIEQIKTRVPDEYESMIESALQSEFGAFIRNIRKIADSMTCISGNPAPYATVGKLEFRSETPAIVTFEGDPMEEIEHENEIIQCIMVYYDCVVRSNGRNTFVRRHVRHISNQQITSEDNKLTGYSPISIVIKTMPGSNLIKVWTTGYNFSINSNTANGGLIFRDALREITRNIDGAKPIIMIKSVTGERIYMNGTDGAIDGAVIDLDNLFQDKKAGYIDTDAVSEN